MGKTKDVRAAVEAELGFDPLVDSSDIKVMNIGGDVTLAGRSPRRTTHSPRTSPCRTGWRRSHSTATSP